MATLRITEIVENPLRELSPDAPPTVEVERLKMQFDAPIPPDLVNKIVALVNVAPPKRRRGPSKKRAATPGT